MVQGRDRRRTAVVVAWIEIVLGSAMLAVTCTDGVRHGGSFLSSYLSLWGSLAVLFGLLFPGLLLRSRYRAWGCQFAPAMLIALVVTAVLSALFGSP